MNALKEMFPDLTLFSDLNWDQVTEEYQRDNNDISFPEYLQKKAIEGDCPPYLFELAFYELAKSEAHHLEEALPTRPGIYLNPTALFLSLEFDVVKMLDEAKKGIINIYERPHVLCIFQDTQKKIQQVELNTDDLTLLEFLEDGPQKNKNFVAAENEKTFTDLMSKGLIFYHP